MNSPAENWDSEYFHPFDFLFPRQAFESGGDYLDFPASPSEFQSQEK